MPVELRPISADELPAFTKTAALVYAIPPPDEARLAELADITEFDRTLAGFEGDRLIATSVTASYRLSVPGAVLPAGGLASVAVAPTHRRQGLLTEIMRHHLAEGRRRGEPLACLWASEAPIYGRFGYGVASRSLRWELHRRFGEFRPELRGKGRAAASRVELLDPETPAADVLDRIRPIHDSLLDRVPGVLERPEPMWRSRLRRPGSDVRWAVFPAADGTPVGYAGYRVATGYTEAGTENTLSITELVAPDLDGYAGLLRFLLDHDLVGKVNALFRPIDEPLGLMLADPRRLSATPMEGIWLRLLDVGAALSLRRYGVSDRIVLGVEDPFPQPATTNWCLDAGPDGATCQPTAEAPDVTLGVGDLAAAYLGGTRCTDLVRAGLATEHSEGAALAATRLLAWDPQPWAPTYF
jgi:predicted acetyltransferase